MLGRWLSCFGEVAAKTESILSMCKRDHVPCAQLTEGGITHRFLD